MVVVTIYCGCHFDQSKKLEQVIFADFLRPQAKKLAKLSELSELEDYSFLITVLLQ